jgi:hypothetical protein
MALLPLARMAAFETKLSVQNKSQMRDEPVVRSGPARFGSFLDEL